MKPGFALSLSFEGISLLHRAAGGWRTVGDVTLDNADLGAALADLRDKAQRLSPGGLSCKLIIPNEQIRYLTVESGSATNGARTEMVLAALDGATPYPVAELAFDISVEGDMTHVAAVARETLAEAEAFAVEHMFNPVSFVAIPGDNLYLGEPHFGPTSHAAEFLGDDAAEADRVAVVVIGMADIPKAAPAPKPEPKPEPEPEIPTAGFASRRRKSPQPVIDPPTQATREMPLEAVHNATVEPTPDKKTAPIAAPEIAPVPPSENAPVLSGATRDSEASAPNTTPPPSVVKSPTAAPIAVPVPGPSKEQAATPKIDAAETKSGFLSRRKNKTAPAASAPPVTAAPVSDPAASAPPIHRIAPVELPDAASSEGDRTDEKQRMTVFGARTEPEIGGKPRHLGLILTAVLLLFLAGIAAWASLFMDTKVSRWLFLDPGDTELAMEPEPIQEAPVIAPPQAEPQTAETEQFAPLPEPEDQLQASLPSAAPGLTDTDSAVLDALREPDVTVTEPEPEIATLDRVVDLGHDAPRGLETPAIIGLGDLYIASIDRTDLSHDAVALPSLGSLNTDDVPGSIASPVAAGTEFSLDARGLVTPTVNGTVNPDGVIVYLGQPPIRPPPTPARDDPEAEQKDVQNYLAGLRPLARPDDLAELNERANLGGLTHAELGRVRPLMRPELPAITEPVDATGTKLAVAVSVKPLLRPAGLAPKSRVSNLGSTANISQVATIAPRTVKPKIPSSASVARQATLDNAINLRKINLIGVYGTKANRRALVRLPSGRYRKIKVGDSIDGGRVLAISDSELRYQKGGRNLTLKIPSG
jgi:hypothetical protein